MKHKNTIDREFTQSVDDLYKWWGTRNPRGKILEPADLFINSLYGARRPVFKLYMGPACALISNGNTNLYIYIYIFYPTIILHMLMIQYTVNLSLVFSFSFSDNTPSRTINISVNFH